MDSESSPFSISQNPTHVNYTNQAPNQFTSISPPFQPPYQFNLVNGSCSPYTNLSYGPPFSFQNLLNTPVFSSGATENPRASGGGRKKHKDVQNNLNTSQSTTIKREDWSSEEDIALTEAWLNISTDPDVGNNQKSTAMWERISQVWKDKMGESCKARSSNSLQCRWNKMQKAVNKFHGIYEKLERHPQSGSNPEDMKRRALVMYERQFSDKKKKEFKYIHCWELLITNPKWCTNQLSKASALDKSSSDKKTTTEVRDTPSIPETQSMEPEQVKTDGIVRPLGRKSAKDRKRKLNSENGVVEALNKLQCTLDKQIEYNKAELEMKKENQMNERAFREQVMKKEIELKEHDKRRADQERIMNLNLSTLSPTVRAKYEILQARILEEWEIGSFS